MVDVLFCTKVTALKSSIHLWYGLSKLSGMVISGGSAEIQSSVIFFMKNKVFGLVRQHPAANKKWSAKIERDFFFSKKWTTLPLKRRLFNRIIRQKGHFFEHFVKKGRLISTLSKKGHFIYDFVKKDDFATILSKKWLLSTFARKRTILHLYGGKWTFEKPDFFQLITENTIFFHNKLPIFTGKNQCFWHASAVTKFHSHQSHWPIKDPPQTVRFKSDIKIIDCLNA